MRSFQGIFAAKISDINIAEHISTTVLKEMRNFNFSIQEL